MELNNGESNSVAAEKSGLTAGQVSYLLGRFKKVGMELFTAQTVKKAASKKAPVKKAATKKAVVKKAAAKKATPAVTKSEVEDATPAAKGPVSADKTEDKKKKKKGKKSSKKDKAKKDSNKIKKDKKGKKNKKGKKKKSKKNKK
ncbi:MAG: hypothetical protein KAU21_06240 [Gammaproteobacteria bacterium]|nr:hypothetical protein [Gammaproteobacteria bacterium]